MMVSSNLQYKRNTVEESLRSFGYGEGCVKVDWPITSTYPGGSSGAGVPTGRKNFVDLIAFYDPREHDWQTSVIAADFQPARLEAETSRSRSQQLFKCLATPVTIVGSQSDSVVDVWFSCQAEETSVERGVNLAVDTLTRLFEQRRSEIQRESLANLRMGQRHLFDRYLYVQRDQIAEFLQNGMLAASELIEPLRTRADKRQTQHLQEMFSRIALGLLAARILEDKGALGERDQATEAMSLLETARERHDSFFDAVLDEDYVTLRREVDESRLRDAIDHVFLSLTGPHHFGMVTHEMLGDLYESMLSIKTKAGNVEVKSQGAHYTPSGIASHIVERVPLELLPVDERRICDFTCGSGSFLLSATEALRRIYDPRESSHGPAPYKYLRKNVFGNDIDRVSILICELSYLVAYWQRMDSIPTPVLRKEDATTLDFTTCFDAPPTVMVGNPPFNAAAHVSVFFLKALDALAEQDVKRPRYLGMVLPRSFLTGQEYSRARSRLRSCARLLEIWELPDRAIGIHAQAPTCVILAEVGRPTGTQHSMRICQVNSRRKEAISAFRDQALSTWSYTVDVSGTDSGDSSSLAFSPIEKIWTQLADCPRLSEIADVVWGFTHTRKANKDVPVFSKRQLRGYVPFIRHQKALQPYYLKDEDWKSSHGKEMECYWKKGSGWSPQKKHWSKYEEEKIIVSARTNRNAGSQLVAAIDNSGIFPAKDFLVVTLKDGGRALRNHFGAPHPRRPVLLLQWLCAVLNSPIAHAWVARNAGPRGPRRDVFLNMPLPRIFHSDITHKMAQLCRLKRPQHNLDSQDLTQDVVPYSKVVGKINSVILRSYGLNASDRTRLKQYLNSITDPWAAHSAHVADLSGKPALRLLTGRTVSVDDRRQQLTAEFTWRTLENGNPVKIPIPCFMPGWAMDPSKEFTCRTFVGCTTQDLVSNPWLLRDFRPASYQYLPQEELEALVGYQPIGNE